MFLARQSKNNNPGGSLLRDYTRRFGYDTIRLNWELGSDATVNPMPSEYLWYGDKPLSYPSPDDPLQTRMQLKCLEVDAFGGGKRNLKNGDLLLWRRQEGVFYELRRGQYKNLLSLETSLPKLLFGHNKYPVAVDMLPAAFDELTRRGREFIPCLPDVSELEAWRIDATSDVKLRSELEVGLVGLALYKRPLNGVLPTLHPSGGSVSWAASSGLPGARCYGKSEESGDEKIAGVYRNETQVMGGNQFRKALAFAIANGDLSPELVAGKGVRCLKGSALIEQGQSLCTGLLGALIGVCDSAIDFVREVNTLTALEAINLLEQKAGVTRSRAAQLVGYAHIVRVLGWNFTGLGRKGVWLAQNEFKAAGVDAALIEFSSAERFVAHAGMVVGGALAGGIAIAGAVAGSEIVDALLPEKSPSKKSAEPASDASGELDKAA